MQNKNSSSSVIMAYKLNDGDIVDCLFDSDAEISDLPSDNNSFVEDSDVDHDFLPSLSVSNSTLVITPSSSDSDLQEEPIPSQSKKKKLTPKCKKNVKDTTMYLWYLLNQF